MTTSGRIRGFDGLRAIAVCCVFLTHETTLGNRLALGGPGVWLFFVLSGFLIISILHRERQRIEAGEISVRAALLRFVGRRARRIFPVYYLALFVLVPILLAAGVNSIDPLGFAMMATYLTNIWVGSVLGHLPGVPLGHLWSLAVEEQFYVLMPLVALPFASHRLRGICLAIVGVAVAAKLAMTLGGTPKVTIYTSSLVNFGMIAFGGWCALSMAPRGTEGRSGWAIVLPLGLYAVVAVGGHLAKLPVPLLQFTPALVGIALIAVARNQASWAVAALEVAPLKFLGRISYGFYVYHPMVALNMLVPAARIFGIRLPFPERGAAVISFIVAVSVAWASWRFIERPLLSRRFGRDAPLTAAIGAPS